MKTNVFSTYLQKEDKPRANMEKVHLVEGHIMRTLILNIKGSTLVITLKVTISHPLGNTLGLEKKTFPKNIKVDGKPLNKRPTTRAMAKKFLDEWNSADLSRVKLLSAWVILPYFK